MYAGGTFCPCEVPARSLEGYYAEFTGSYGENTPLIGEATFPPRATATLRNAPEPVRAGASLAPVLVLALIALAWKAAA